MMFAMMQSIPNLTEYAKTIIGILAIFGVAIEVTPIKVNPVSAIIRWVGRVMNKDIEDKIDKLDKKFSRHETDQLRRGILDFANSCMRGEEHTMEEFDNIFHDYDDYEEILKCSNMENGRIEQTMEYIKEVYRDCSRYNKFL